MSDLRTVLYVTTLFYSLVGESQELIPGVNGDGCTSTPETVEYLELNNESREKFESCAFAALRPVEKAQSELLTACDQAFQNVLEKGVASGLYEGCSDVTCIYYSGSIAFRWRSDRECYEFTLQENSENTCWESGTNFFTSGGLTYKLTHCLEDQPDTPDPSPQPTHLPTTNPTYDPTAEPTSRPTHMPSFSPTDRPTSNPTKSPTIDPCSMRDDIYWCGRSCCNKKLDHCLWDGGTCLTADPDSDSEDLAPGDGNTITTTNNINTRNDNTNTNQITLSIENTLDAEATGGGGGDGGDGEGGDDHDDEEEDEDEEEEEEDEDYTDGALDAAAEIVKSDNTIVIAICATIGGLCFLAAVVCGGLQFSSGADGISIRGLSVD